MTIKTVYKRLSLEVSKFGKVKAFILFLFVVALLVALSGVIFHCRELNKSTTRLVESTQQILIEERRKETWEEYKIHIELYKYYLDIFLKASLALLGITGAILTFYFTNKAADSNLLKKALLLPFTFNLSYAGVYFYGAWLWCEVSVTVEVLRKQIGNERVPDIQLLTVLLIVFGTIFYIVGLALLWFMWRDDSVDKARERAAQQLVQPDRP